MDANQKQPDWILSESALLSCPVHGAKLIFVCASIGHIKTGRHHVEDARISIRTLRFKCPEKYCGYTKEELG